jgi:hypothetical protein
MAGIDQSIRRLAMLWRLPLPDPFSWYFVDLYLSFLPLNDPRSVWAHISSWKADGS